MALDQIARPHEEPRGDVCVHRPFAPGVREHAPVEPERFVRGNEIIVGDDVGQQMSGVADCDRALLVAPGRAQQCGGGRPGMGAGERLESGKTTEKRDVRKARARKAKLGKARERAP